jgi:hypothetical protein
VSIAQKLIEELESDEKVRRRLSRLLASDIALDTEARVAIVNAIIREVATKNDIEALRNATKSDIEALRKEFKSDIEALRREFREEIGRLDGRISSLEQRVARLEGSINLFMKLFVAFNLPLLVSVVAALVTLLLRAP